MKDKAFVEATAVWLRRRGDYIEVLVEFAGDFRLAITEHYDGPFSHIAEAAGYKNWKKDPITTTAQEAENDTTCRS